MPPTVSANSRAIITRCGLSQFLDSPGESIDVDHAAAMDALGDDFHTVVGLDLECDGRPST